ncbi:MAG: hypothetical protein FWB89_01135 [Treponema sp.]|nr:hypothetical protein [Treponema sp.]
MNKKINFEDTLFIINVRIRMIKDLLQIDTDSGLFYRQTMADMEFISSVLDIMTEKFLSNMQFLDRETEADNLLDTEWQFSQILNEVSGISSPYSNTYFPETQTWIDKLRSECIKRKKRIEEAYVPVELSMSEPVVTHAELNGLLGST